MGAPLQGPERGGVDSCVDPSASHIQPPAGFKPAGSFNMRSKAGFLTPVKPTNHRSTGSCAARRAYSELRKLCLRVRAKL
jgi:hypothetical protein